MTKKIIGVLLALCALTTSYAQDNDRHNFDVTKNLEVFNTVYKYLDMMYVDTLNANEVVRYGLGAMLNSLDPYTVYYPADDTKELDLMLTGRYGGIGAIIRYDLVRKTVVIDEPYEDTPAAKAGLRKGDVIVSIDDSTMTGKPAAYVSSHLRGDAGSTFEIKIMRPSTGKTFRKIITREQIQQPAVAYYGVQPGGIGYLCLTSYTENCARDVRRAVLDMKHQGMKSLVLDLRGNGGGSVQEAISIVNMFVPKGETILTMKGKIKQANREFTTKVEPIDTVMPIVVLVNDQTASASEITCGSLQDLDRAVVMGTRTFGKGLVQSTFDLPYNGVIKLTTSKYYIPSGRCIQAINYRHGRGGYTEHIPDSLTHTFTTRHGRIVRDGGGIKPDIEVLPDSLPNIAISSRSPIRLITPPCSPHPSADPPPPLRTAWPGPASLWCSGRRCRFPIWIRSGGSRQAPQPRTPASSGSGCGGPSASRLGCASRPAFPPAPPCCRCTSSAPARSAQTDKSPRPPAPQKPKY